MKYLFLCPTFSRAIIHTWCIIDWMIDYGKLYFLLLAWRKIAVLSIMHISEGVKSKCIMHTKVFLFSLSSSVLFKKKNTHTFRLLPASEDKTTNTVFMTIAECWCLLVCSLLVAKNLNIHSLYVFDYCSYGRQGSVGLGSKSVGNQKNHRY